MKKIITVIGILLLLGAFLLTGCTRDEPEKQPDETKVTEAPTMPVEEDVHYFVKKIKNINITNPNLDMEHTQEQYISLTKLILKHQLQN